MCTRSGNILFPIPRDTSYSPFKHGGGIKSYWIFSPQPPVAWKNLKKFIYALMYIICLVYYIKFESSRTLNYIPTVCETIFQELDLHIIYLFLKLGPLDDLQRTFPCQDNMNIQSWLAVTWRLTTFAWICYCSCCRNL